MPGDHLPKKSALRKKLLRKLSVAARKRIAAKKEVQSATAKKPSDPLQALLRAATFAATKHHGQMRADGTVPYFAHVARVTLVLALGFGVRDPEVLTASLLHDTIEDTATDYDEIAEIFGQRVADYVVLLTKNALLPKKEREEDYEARLREAPEEVKIAKMADLYDNLSARIDSPKLPKTSETATRMLNAFANRLTTHTGRAAHEKLFRLLEEIKAIRPVQTASKAKH
jgi:(p)ppGpp synthase/HD superfamily hydrolase